MLKYKNVADLLFAIPNGGHRHKVVAAKMKAEGAKAGVPDLLLAVPTSKYAGLFIEMKAPKGTVRKEQKKYLKMLAAVGYKTAVCRTFPDFQNVIFDYFDKVDDPCLTQKNLDYLELIRRK
jgi:hypothetical protein